MERDEFFQIYGECDTLAIKMLTYEALLLLLRSGKGTAEDLALFSQFEDDLGKFRFAQAA